MRRPNLLRWALIGAGGVSAALAIVSLGCNVYQRGSSARSEEIAQEIGSLLRRDAVGEDAPHPDRRTLSLLRTFYEARDMKPAWTNGRGLGSSARTFVDVIEHAGDEGLNPQHYGVSILAERREDPGEDPRALAETDVLYTAAALQYMSDLFDGRISPRLLDAEWAATPRRGDLDSVLTHALEKKRLKQELEALAPTQEGYRALRDARKELAKIAETGGSAPASAPGGDAADSAGLRLSAQDQLRIVELNMERWRWLPKSFGERHLIVNIPEYVLRVVEHDKTTLEMRVVVGKSVSATPVFSDSLTYIVIHPDWNVPESIVVEEIVPALEKDSEYLAKNHMRIFDGPGEDATEIDAASIDWSDSASVAAISVRQDPWEGNSLGRIKFMFPNQFNVYFHDTPEGELFALEKRGFSHGCVRVEDPVALAAALMRDDPNGDPESIRALLERDETKTLSLPHPVPVHIVYFTAFVDDDGTPRFREDIYGVDRELGEELRGKEREAGLRERVAQR